MPPAIPFIGLAIAAASAGFSVASKLKEAKQQKKRARAQQEIQRIQQVKADTLARRERQKQLRETRIRRSQIIQAGISSGAGIQTTTVVGAAGGVGTQFGANIGEIGEAQGFGERISRQSEKAAQAESGAITERGRQGLFSAIGGVGENIFDRGGGFTSTFGGNTNTEATT